MTISLLWMLPASSFLLIYHTSLDAIACVSDTTDVEETTGIRIKSTDVSSIQATRDNDKNGEKQGNCSVNNNIHSLKKSGDKSYRILLKVRLLKKKIYRGFSCRFLCVIVSAAWLSASTDNKFAVHAAQKISSRSTHTRIRLGKFLSGITFCRQSSEFNYHAARSVRQNGNS
ncbi:hypothetical protein T11_16321 [Trichinella zimbabwensis]|uniref:Secreted protein n=1 Tax=Trichinella zimbabwensis TaxID=268475 RepID=A0A0V1HRX2_9BILA|nr:hypothetical protein T11_16321 [Trichinella zimbabwensis]